MSQPNPNEPGPNLKPTSAWLSVSGYCYLQLFDDKGKALWGSYEADLPSALLRLHKILENNPHWDVSIEMNRDARQALAQAACLMYAVTKFDGKQLIPEYFELNKVACKLINKLLE
jgi:hypothetical protein